MTLDIDSLFFKQDYLFVEMQTPSVHRSSAYIYVVTDLKNANRLCHIAFFGRFFIMTDKISQSILNKHNEFARVFKKIISHQLQLP